MRSPLDPADDDTPIGELLTRRAWMRFLAGSGAVFATGRAMAGEPPRICVVRPATTAGPFYVDEQLNRSDLRLDPSDGSVREGVQLDLQFNVSRFSEGTCVPFPNAIVDVWHCDAAGVYSDVRGRTGNATGRKFLRGHQFTDAAGVARFTTIYPGWYPGRTVHVHFKVRSAPEAPKPFEFISQLFFDDALTDTVHARPPYAARGARNMRNEEDGIFREGGKELILALNPVGEGFKTAFDLAVAVDA